MTFLVDLIADLPGNVRLPGASARQEVPAIRMLVASLYASCLRGNDLETNEDLLEQWWEADELPAEFYDYINTWFPLVDQYLMETGEGQFLADHQWEPMASSTVNALLPDTIPMEQAHLWALEVMMCDTGGIKSGVAGDPLVKSSRRNVGSPLADKTIVLYRSNESMVKTVLLNTPALDLSEDHTLPWWEEEDLANSRSVEHHRVVPRVLSPIAALAPSVTRRVSWQDIGGTGRITHSSRTAAHQFQKATAGSPSMGSMDPHLVVSVTGKMAGEPYGYSKIDHLGLSTISPLIIYRQLEEEKRLTTAHSAGAMEKVIEGHSINILTYNRKTAPGGLGTIVYTTCRESPLSSVLDSTDYGTELLAAADKASWLVRKHTSALGRNSKDHETLTPPFDLMGEVEEFIWAAVAGDTEGLQRIAQAQERWIHGLLETNEVSDEKFLSLMSALRALSN